MGNFYARCQHFPERMFVGKDASFNGHASFSDASFNDNVTFARMEVFQHQQ